ncbi:MAG: hypothetical protein AAGJ35_02930, partial [Myxococcota bacterium]
MNIPKQTFDALDLPSSTPQAYFAKCKWFRIISLYLFLQACSILTLYANPHHAKTPHTTQKPFTIEQSSCTNWQYHGFFFKHCAPEHGGWIRFSHPLLNTRENRKYIHSSVPLSFQIRGRTLHFKSPKVMLRPSSTLCIRLDSKLQDKQHRRLGTTHVRRFLFGRARPSLSVPQKYVWSPKIHTHLTFQAQNLETVRVRIAPISLHQMRDWRKRIEKIPTQRRLRPPTLKTNWLRDQTFRLHTTPTSTT